MSPALSALPQEEGEAAILTGLEVSGVHPPRSSARFGTSVKDSSCKKEWEKIYMSVKGLTLNLQ